MLTNLFFVRHAHSVYTPEELTRPLSEKGVKDSNLVTDILKHQNIDHVISSPYQRAIQTVEGVAKSRGKIIETIDGFKERILSQSPVEDFQLAVEKVWEEPTFSWDGGESNVNAQERGIHALNNLLARYAGKNIVIGTHGNILTLMFNYYDKQYNYEFWKRLEMPDIYQATFWDKSFVNVRKLWKRVGRYNE